MSSMSEEEFVKRIRQAEQETATHPRRYLVKLALFAILGYVAIFGVLMALVGLAGGLVAAAFFSTALFLILLKKKLVFVILLAIWVLLKALWVRFEAPQGYTLKRKECPRLFEEIDRLSRQLKTVRIHRVILDNNLNAAVVQHPRLGVFGWNRNYLIVGYPLMLTLSPEEMRSVLAHEFGHLSGNHSRFHGWIYRVRLSWHRIMVAFDGAESWGASLMRRFFNWYSPRFEAYSFALARSNEYEADAIAAQLTSPATAARALVNVYATAPYIDDHYWKTYFSKADETSEPPFAPFAGLARFLDDNPLGREQMQERIAEEMQVQTHYANTHPSLRDRLRNLGETPTDVTVPERNAAEAWLGERGRQVMADFDREWLTANGEAWRARYEYVANARAELQKLEGCDPAELGDEALWDYACWSREFVSDDQALPLFMAFRERHPDATGCAFYLACILLKRGDEAGLEPLALARTNPNLIGDCARFGYQFLLDQGRQAEAEAWWQDSLKQQEVFVAAHKERQGVGRKEALVKPEIERDRLDDLVAQLKRIPKVGKVWLAQKPVQHMPEDPVYVLAFKTRGFVFSRAKLQSRVAESLEVEGTFFVVCRSGDAKALAKKVIKRGQRIA
ncbi:M48 family metallopeptidase [Marinobacter daepoensis]|uniref:M48 family metallopeptidase n=1 Tax=Marinobacter daepoensis TaxID=262077 RepID=UPI00040BD24C|nr:M48 family metallopeptidase [Marinobacter daepoensis]